MTKKTTENCYKT